LHNARADFQLRQENGFRDSPTGVERIGGQVDDVRRRNRRGDGLLVWISIGRRQMKLLDAPALVASLSSASRTSRLHESIRLRSL
jgi:hypothetical protein